MKILQPTEVKGLKDSQVQRDILRAKSVKDVLNKEQNKLDNVVATFEVTLSNQLLRWAKEEQKATEQIGSLLKEIKDLEEKRAVLLIPIQLDEERARIKLEEAEKALNDAETLRSSNEETAEILADKLDAISEREQFSSDLEQKLKGKAQNIRVQEEVITKLSTELSTKWDEYFKAKEDQNLFVNNALKDIELKRISLAAREDMLVEKEKGLNIISIQLQSQRQILERAIKKYGQQRKE